MKRFAPILAALLASTAAPVPAQDIIGFDIGSFGSIVLKRDQFGGDIVPEAAFGDYNNEPISTYSAKSVFASIGRSVGRLDVATDVQVFPCTAFLVAEDLIMTNHHCVPGILDHPRAGASAIIGVKFVAGYTREGVTEGARSFLVNPVPVETNKDLDYTLLRIIGDKPGRDFGVLRLAARAPENNEPYWIIGHPMGEAQRISREKCRANAPAVSEGRLLHTCDTLPGNSGSPVIDAGSQQVIGLHNAGSDRNAINYAIPMARILQSSRVLKAAPGPETRQDKPDPEALADRALTRLFTLQDDTQLEAGLTRLMREFPGTSAAKAAKRRLDGFKRQREQAERRKREDDANAALLAAIVLPEVAARRAALQALIDTYPDTGVVSAANSMLAGLKDPEPGRPQVALTNQVIRMGEMLPPGTTVQVTGQSVFTAPSPFSSRSPDFTGQLILGPHAGDGWYALDGGTEGFIRLPTGRRVLASSAPVPDPEQADKTASPQETRDVFIASNQMLPEGTRVQVSGQAIYTAPSRFSTRARTVTGPVVLGRYRGGGWYAVADTPGEYIGLPPAGRVRANADPVPITASQPVKPAAATGVFPEGTKLRIKSLTVHAGPSDSSKVISYLYGSVTLGKHVRDSWYAVADRPNRYVNLPREAEPVTATPRTPQPDSTPRPVAGQVFPQGTKLKIKSLTVHADPSDSSKVISYLYGSVTLGVHVRDDWYRLADKPGRYVRIAAGTESLTPVTAAQGIHPPGTTLRIKSLTAHALPASTSRTVSYLYGRVTVGDHVRDDWYRVDGKTQFVQIPKDAEVLSGTKAAAASGPLPRGTRLTFAGSLAVYRAPTEASETRKEITGSVRIGQHIGDGWYTLQEGPGYVRPAPGVIAGNR